MELQASVDAGGEGDGSEQTRGVSPVQRCVEHDGALQGCTGSVGTCTDVGVGVGLSLSGRGGHHSSVGTGSRAVAVVDDVAGDGSGSGASGDGSRRTRRGSASPVRGYDFFGSPQTVAALVAGDGYRVAPIGAISSGGGTAVPTAPALRPHSVAASPSRGGNGGGQHVGNDGAADDDGDDVVAGIMSRLCRDSPSPSTNVSTAVVPSVRPPAGVVVSGSFAGNDNALIESSAAVGNRHADGMQLCDASDDDDDDSDLVRPLQPLLSPRHVISHDIVDDASAAGLIHINVQPRHGDDTDAADQEVSAVSHRVTVIHGPSYTRLQPLRRPVPLPRAPSSGRNTSLMRSSALGQVDPDTAGSLPGRIDDFAPPTLVRGDSRCMPRDANWLLPGDSAASGLAAAAAVVPSLGAFTSTGRAAGGGRAGAVSSCDGVPLGASGHSGRGGGGEDGWSGHRDASTALGIQHGDTWAARTSVSPSKRPQTAGSPTKRPPVTGPARERGRPAAAAAGIHAIAESPVGESPIADHLFESLAGNDDLISTLFGDVA